MSTWPITGGITPGFLQNAWPPSTSGNEGHVHLPFPAGAHTMGAWAQVYATTPFDAVGFDIVIRAHPVNNQQVYQIGIGGAGSEVVLYEQGIPAESFASATKIRIRVPLNIAKGVRVAARAQRTIAGAVTNGPTLAVTLLPRTPFMPLGFNGVEYVNQPSLATSVPPVSFAPGNVGSGTSGLVTEISAGIANHWKAFTVTFGGADTSNLSNTLPAFAFALLRGAGGSEVREYGFVAVSGAARSVIDHALGPIGCDFPAGSRLCVEVLASTTSDGTTNRARITIQGYY